MKKIFLAFTLTLCGMVVLAQEPDATFKLLRQEWVVNSDGTCDYHYRHEVQILRNRALTAYADKGETFVVYNPDIEQLTINEVYTIQANGKRVEMPQNAFIYQLPAQCTDCGRFNHLRELAMVHTGMEIGCTIVVDYTMHSQVGLLNKTLQLVRECPIEHYELKVSVPQDQELNILLSNPQVVPFDATYQQTANTYSLSATNIPQTFVDAYLPEASQLYPTLHFYNSAIVFTPDFDQRGLAATSDIANQLITGSDERKNIEAIHQYVLRNIHLNDIAPEHLGYTHATAAEVWQSGCGTATDKAVLLAAMLNQQGYNASVAGNAYDEVSVMLDTLEYRLSTRGTTSGLTPYGEAKDEVFTLRTKQTHDEPHLDTLTDGFFCLNVRMPGGLPLSVLSPSRTAPLQSSPCDIQASNTYNVGKLKMVGGSIEREANYPGIGSVKVSIKQKGKKVVVESNLKLEQSIVPTADYAKYRELIACWNLLDKVYLRKK